MDASRRKKKMHEKNLNIFKNNPHYDWLSLLQIQAILIDNIHLHINWKPSNCFWKVETKNEIG